jgi:hypothetical protein
MKLNLTLVAIVTLILYVIVIGFLIFAIYFEHKDATCSAISGGVCGEGMGTAYYQGKYKEGDTQQEILEKIRLTALYETNSINWRRIYISAAISSFATIFIVKNSMPTGIELAAGFIITYIIGYLAVESFARWVTKPANAQLDILLEKAGLQ